MRKNLILFRGNLVLTIDRHIKEYERLFREKYGELQVSRISLSDASLSEIENELLALPFFSPMRLVSVRWAWVDEKKMTAKATLLVSLIDRIPDSSVVLFSQMDHPEFHSTLQILESVAQIKIFSVTNTDETVEYIIDRLGVSRSDATLLAQVVGEDMIRLESEIHKFSLVPPEDRGSLRDHLEHTSEVKIFDISDALLSTDTQKALRLLTQSAETSDIRMLLSGLTSTIRGLVYTVTLSSIPRLQKELALHDFVRWKYARLSRSQGQAFEILYDDLVRLDLSSKSTQIPGGTDEGVLFGIQSAFFAFQRHLIEYNTQR